MMNDSRRRLIQVDSQPKTTGSTPATGAAAGGVAITAIPGSGYVTGGRCSLYNLTTGIEYPCTGAGVTGPTTATATSPAAPAGTYRLLVRNPDGSVSSTPWTQT